MDRHRLEHHNNEANEGSSVSHRLEQEQVQGCGVCLCQQRGFIVMYCFLCHKALTFQCLSNMALSLGFWSCVGCLPNSKFRCCSASFARLRRAAGCLVHPIYFLGGKRGQKATERCVIDLFLLPVAPLGSLAPLIFNKLDVPRSELQSQP